MTSVSDWIWLGFYKCRTLRESNALIGNLGAASINPWISAVLACDPEIRNVAMTEMLRSDLHPVSETNDQPETSAYSAESKTHPFPDCPNWGRQNIYDHRDRIIPDVIIARSIGSANGDPDEAATLFYRCAISIALKTTRLKISSDSSILFDGVMHSGALRVSTPSQGLAAECSAPDDFIHLHVSHAFLREQESNSAIAGSARTQDLNGIIVRDPLIEVLSRALAEESTGEQSSYVEALGKSVVMRLLRLKLPQSKSNALPNWRLKRVEGYIDAHITELVSLEDLAASAGLSRMYFAAQFKAATGYRPREYVLSRRIEHAKGLMLQSDAELVEVALSAGFCGQAHFQTVFKRFVAETPAQWRKRNSKR
jgi:AraC-like DNA-binding protein